MNNPANAYGVANVQPVNQVPVSNTNPVDENVQQLGTSQSNYINHFMNSAEPITTFQTPPSFNQNQTDPSFNGYNNSNLAAQANTQAPVSNPQDTHSSPPSTPVSYLPGANDLNNQQLSNTQSTPLTQNEPSSNYTPQSMAPQPFVAQPLNQNLRPDPIGDLPSNNTYLPNSYGQLNQNPSDLTNPVAQNVPQFNEFNQPTPQNLTTNLENTVSMNQLVNPPYAQLTTQPVNLAPQSTPQSDTMNTMNPINFTIPQSTFNPSTETNNQAIGMHQVSINQDYAEQYQRNQQQYQPLRPANTPFTSTQNSLNFASPPSMLTVDNDFSDGSGQTTDDPYNSTSVLPAFDDTTDDQLAPLASDDDADDAFSSDSEPDNLIPYGFSDYDPNEQSTGSFDSLSGFESQSLEEEANRIDVDFSEAMPTTTQGVGLLTQAPPVNQIYTYPPQTSSPVVNTVSYVAPVEPATNTITSTQLVSNNIEPQNQQVQDFVQQEQPTVQMPTNNYISPAAKLNQLLEEEDAAEKVIMQKQEQSIDKNAEKTVTQSSKANIFQQLNPDTTLQGDLHNGMAIKKPTSRYFLIISLVIIISVIGFLLVLLGLTLL